MASTSKASRIGAKLFRTTESKLGSESSATWLKDTFRSITRSPRRSQWSTCSETLLPETMNPPKPAGTRPIRVTRSMKHVYVVQGLGNLEEVGILDLRGS